MLKSFLFFLIFVCLLFFSEHHFSLIESIQKFKTLLAGIGVENCPQNGGLECFDVNQAKVITDYFTDR